MCNGISSIAHKVFFFLKYMGVIISSPKEHVAIILNGALKSNDDSCGLVNKNAFHDIIEVAKIKGITHLTLLESHSRKRSDKIVSLVYDSQKWLNNIGICFRYLSNLKQNKSQLQVDTLEKKTLNNKDFYLTLISCYDGRNAIFDAVHFVLRDVENQNITANEISIDKIASHLVPIDMPDLDLIVITGGRRQIDNQLVWQCAYSEFIFIEELWEELYPSLFVDILAEYARRNRRFGGRPDE